MKNRIKRGIKTAVLALMLGTVFVPLHTKAALPEVTYDANAKKTGYHLVVDVQRNCVHLANMQTKTVVCELNGLNHSQREIRSAVTSTGGLGYELTFAERAPQGELNHEVGRVVCTAYVPTAGMYLELAGPYWCPDGYAGYVYYRHYFSHCNYTGVDYFVASQHHWLGCARGDVGENEFHEREFSHTLTRYKFVANNYTVRYNGNGSTSGTLADQKPAYDQEFNLRKNGYQKAGHTFSGWNTKKDGSGTLYAEGKNVKNLTEKNGGTVTLYAQWKVNSYKVTYDGNGATNGSLANQKPKYNQEFNLRKNGYKKSGYIFTGWNTKVDGGGTSYTEGQKVKNLTEKNGGTVTLYAQWKAGSYTVTYDGNGATSGNLANQKPKYGQEFSLRKNGYERTGYTFTGWDTKADGGGTSYTEGQKVKNLTEKDGGNVVLYAQWKANSYTIRFDGNGAIDGAMEDIIAAFGQEIQLPENLFTRTTEQGESIFAGWNQNPEVYETEFADQETIKNLSVEDGAVVVLYAIWDDCPEIEACDRYFSLSFAQEGKITEEELLSTASATDQEDGDLENRTSAQIASSGMEGSLSLYGYAAADFTGMTDSGSVSMTYRAVDSIGNTIYKMVTIFVTSTEPVTEDIRYVRSIDQKYYRESYEKGGVHPESLWRKEEYKDVLENIFENISNHTPEQVYRLKGESHRP